MIGLHSDDEPRFFLNKRSLVSVRNATSLGQGGLSGVPSNLWRAYAQVFSSPPSVTLDLMNSLATVIHGGSFVPQGARACSTLTDARASTQAT